jgi:cytochrome c-type biogenesis protein CcmE
MKPKHQRLVFIAVTTIFLCLSVLLTMRAFRDNLVFFFSPSELAERSLSAEQRMRVGGLVETGSIVRADNDKVTFTITDGKATLKVQYQGLLPNLFREGQGVVAEGYLTGDGTFDAKTILAKHDENYMPKEVMDALKKTGHWQGESNNATKQP